MKTISLQEAFKLLDSCVGVLIDCPMDGHVFISPALDKPNGTPDNEFAAFFWTDSEGQDYRVVCHEETNATVTVTQTSMFLKDEDGEDFQVTLLQPMLLE